MPETPDWYMEFVGAVVARLPRDIDEAAARRWLSAPEQLEEALAGALLVSAVGAIDAGAPFANDKTAEGMELLEDVSEPALIAAENLGEMQIFGDDEPFMVGDDVIDRVRSMSPKLGQRHCEYILAHPEMIPEEYNRYTLVFGGTLWRDQAGNHLVPCLHRSRGEWTLIFGILEMGMDNTDRMAVPVGDAPTAAPAAADTPAAAAEVYDSYNPSAPLANDKTSEGMELLEDESEPADFTSENLGEVPVFGDDEPFMVGDDVVDRVRSMSPKLGQRHCEYLLAHPDLIPEAYNRYTLVFGGTVWRDQAGNHLVPCLHRSQGEWKLIFGILEMGMDDTDRMATPVVLSP
jgi:hypothetical protein